MSNIGGELSPRALVSKNGKHRPLLRDGSRGEMPAAVGDSVRFRDFDVTEVDLDGEDYVLVGAQHVMMKWTAQE